ncbi:MAG: HesA/MoeB/ThiF family protein [Thermoplasmata archaeon]
MEKYSRQIMLEQFGTKGQKLLMNKKVLVIGVGGTGGLISQLLVRGGIGTLYISDVDKVSISNIHRQLLFTEKDVGLKKIEIALKYLKSLNSDVNVIPVLEKIDGKNIEEYVREVDLVMDGTDNFLSRYIINDACVKQNKPWIYSGVLATYGTVMPIIPGKTACLRCLMRDPPKKEYSTSELGILNSIPSAIASIAVSLAYKILLGNDVESGLYYYDGWNIALEKINVERQNDCPACSLKRFDFLEQKIE